MSVFDLSGFDEEKNYFRAEPTLVCRAKESVQVQISKYFKNPQTNEIEIFFLLCNSGLARDDTGGRIRAAVGLPAVL